MKTILVTGGAGYIGSHTVVKLLEQGYGAVIVDNLCNSKVNAIHQIESITGRKPFFYEGDMRDRALLAGVFKSHSIDGVIHFAGLKAVAESQAKPLLYYDNNVAGSIALLEEALKANVHTVVFSSSATVYGEPGITQYDETLPTKPINVYGRSKLMVENLLTDLVNANPALRVACLRYFNPVGAHSSGLIGEDPLGIPNNLMPYLGQVALGKLPNLKVYGNDYPTPDGTGLRDYIHVEDLAEGHCLALRYLDTRPGILTVNLGTERPHSVLEVIAAFERASGITVPYEFVGRRSGDLAEYFANAQLAKRTLGWVAQYNLDRMCTDTWRFYQRSRDSTL
ncbi:UDP-glucose 4-epimerase GalE [Polynucleobacter sp. UK-FUSCHL-C3]|uniref:UDP-glucose 4-epimerase n=1 Tax=Polynucleobacter sp. UK-FUSCHL-C3 TaxID=2955208 RepID=A0AAU8A3M3_9BURK